jgi:hypothetical protein
LASASANSRSSLDRKVKGGKVRLSLFGGPGPSQDVEIGEVRLHRPIAQFPPEGTLDARVQLKSL